MKSQKSEYNQEMHVPQSRTAKQPTTPHKATRQQEDN